MQEYEEEVSILAGLPQEGESGCAERYTASFNIFVARHFVVNFDGPSLH